MVVFERGNLLFIFNFHGENSYTDYRVGTEWAGEYSIVLDSDSKEFGGHGRVDPNTKFFTTPMEWNGRKNFLQVSSVEKLAFQSARSCLTDGLLLHSRSRFAHQVYLPTRTTLVLKH